jgi:hypothetical protein
LSNGIAIALYLGLGAILDISIGGDGGDPIATIDFTAINGYLTYVRND